MPRRSVPADPSVPAGRDASLAQGRRSKEKTEAAPSAGSFPEKTDYLVVSTLISPETIFAFSSSTAAFTSSGICWVEPSSP